MGEGDELDALVHRIDPDRWLSSRFIGDVEKRADVVALYAYDHELARAPRVASNALIAEIRLTWWREVLDEIYGGDTVRAHPAARALAVAVRRRALPREPLEAMIDARIDGLDAADGDAGPGPGGWTAVAAAMMLGNADRAEAARLAGEVWENRLHASRDELLAASVAARRLDPSAFPAVAHVTLARAYLRGGSYSKAGSRLRLFYAVLTGRI